jgi:5-methyltetrahydropteroyltriglutamate--homocysteine methyltransferase
MQYSRDRIVTSHAGSLPRPDALIAANQARQSGSDIDEARFQTQLQSAVVDVVRRQQELGIDIPGDGEYGKAMGHRVNYGAWWSYSFQRLGGLDLTGPGLYEIPARRAQPDEVVLTSFADRRDRQRFAAAYADPESGITTGPRARTWPICTGPHTTDIPMKDIVDVMLAIDCGAYSFEAGNVRHEHEWRVWQDVKLPDDRFILPGVVSHATNVVEHPELVAERIVRFANLVGRERVIAATDCGLGGRVHADIAWAKLEALAQGAALASKQLWR